MPQQTTNFSITLPEALLTSKRIFDIQAVRDAIVQIDAQLHAIQQSQGVSGPITESLQAALIQVNTDLAALRALQSTDAQGIQGLNTSVGLIHVDLQDIQSLKTSSAQLTSDLNTTKALQATDLSSIQALQAKKESYDVAFFYEDVPDLNTEIFKLLVSRPFSIAQNFTGSRMESVTVPSTTVVFNITRNQATVGTATFSGSRVSVFSTQASIYFSAGDTLAVVANNYDPTISNINCTILGFI